MDRQKHSSEAHTEEAIKYHPSSRISHIFFNIEKNKLLSCDTFKGIVRCYVTFLWLRSDLVVVWCKSRKRQPLDRLGWETHNFHKFNLELKWLFFPLFWRFSHIRIKFVFSTVMINQKWVDIKGLCSVYANSTAPFQCWKLPQCSVVCESSRILNNIFLFHLRVIMSHLGMSYVFRDGIDWDITLAGIYGPDRDVAPINAMGRGRSDNTTQHRKT